MFEKFVNEKPDHPPYMNNGPVWKSAPPAGPDSPSSNLPASPFKKE
jgi:hypothetical protein